jgi:hypothetical protein
MAASFLFKVVIVRLNHGVWEVLVHWLGRSATDTSWEQLEEFKLDTQKYSSRMSYLLERVMLSTLSWAGNTSGASVILPRGGRQKWLGISRMKISNLGSGLVLY